MQQLQHTSEGRWNIWNMLLKHLKKHLKTLENHCKHTQHPDKHMQRMYVWNICRIQINTLATYVRKNTDETLVTDLCDIHVQPLQHMQHPDLLSTSIWNTCNIPLKHLKHSKHPPATCAFSKTWQPGRRSTTQRDPAVRSRWRRMATGAVRPSVSRYPRR
jgi:hypothetical protein